MVRGQIRPLSTFLSHLREERGRENTKFLTFDNISTSDIIKSDVLKKKQKPTCVEMW